MNEEKYKILIVVDVQNDFVTGSLGSKEAEDIIPNIVKKIEEFDGKTIIFTMDTHFDDDYLNTQEGKKLPIKHCICGTEGRELVEEVMETMFSRQGTRCKQLVTKYSFADSDINEKIFKLTGDSSGDETQIEIIGLCTDICVISNALLIKANYPEAMIRLDASCCAGSTPENHLAALKVMKACQIEVYNE